ncbi:MAG: glycosyltransferase [Sphingomonas taxi]
MFSTACARPTAAAPTGKSCSSTTDRPTRPSPRSSPANQVDSRVVGISLSRNFGKEAALSAGLDNVRGQTVVPIDVDMQDPPEAIVAMIDKWREGYEVV